MLVAATVLTAPPLRQLAAVAALQLHPSFAAVVAQPQVAAALQAVAAEVAVVLAEKCLMYLEPTRLDQ